MDINWQGIMTGSLPVFSDKGAATSSCDKQEKLTMLVTNYRF
jgi:hypothetical protein